MIWRKDSEGIGMWRLFLIGLAFARVVASAASTSDCLVLDHRQDLGDVSTSRLLHEIRHHHDGQDIDMHIERLGEIVRRLEKRELGESDIETMLASMFFWDFDTRYGSREWGLRYGPMLSAYYESYVESIPADRAVLNVHPNVMVDNGDYFGGGDGVVVPGTSDRFIVLHTSVPWRRELASEVRVYYKDELIGSGACGRRLYLPLAIVEDDTNAIELELKYGLRSGPSGEYVVTQIQEIEFVLAVDEKVDMVDMNGDGLKQAIMESTDIEIRCYKKNPNGMLLCELEYFIDWHKLLAEMDGDAKLAIRAEVVSPGGEVLATAYSCVDPVSRDVVIWRGQDALISPSELYKCNVRLSASPAFAYANSVADISIEDSRDDKDRAGHAALNRPGQSETRRRPSKVKYYELESIEFSCVAYEDSH